TIRFAKSFGRPTVNLVPNGMTISGEHGISEHCFEVPRQHSDFKDLMIDALSSWPEPRKITPHSTEPRTVEQPSLFG
ncbi:hypothetical protein, partial [Mycobacterium tuberculosis]|uniref:hypothetical protein n=1 Tax=Mycobacterium tuberculosis TaxID=1773 RepID=UPI00207AC43F